MGRCGSVGEESADGDRGGHRKEEHAHDEVLQPEAVGLLGEAPSVVARHEDPAEAEAERECGEPARPGGARRDEKR